ncbi:MAG: chorismate synthase, partial [Myxococcales bacterium]|nr:chorismate synthase [Myxococcales bacterium]
YGHRDHRGGGRSSGRETVARVIAGVVAAKVLPPEVTVTAHALQIGPHRAVRYEPATIDQNPVRCADPEVAKSMEAYVLELKGAYDSTGGLVEIRVAGTPPHLGEPVFGKLKADLAAGLFSLPAVVGVEYGAGFGAAAMRGSAHNDPFTVDGDGALRTTSNHHGGILGGISSGMPIVLRAAVKPTSSIPRPQATVRADGSPAEIEVRGRHDPCLLPRFVPMAEAMVAWVLADHWLRHVAQTRSYPSPES